MSQTAYSVSEKYIFKDSMLLNWVNRVLTLQFKKPCTNKSSKNNITGLAACVTS